MGATLTHFLELAASGHAQILFTGLVYFPLGYVCYVPRAKCHQNNKHTHVLLEARDGTDGMTLTDKYITAA